MNLNPAKVLDPVFQFLDWIIAEWGVYLFLAFVWLSLLVLAWVFSGGLRRKFPNQPRVSAGIGIIIQPHTPPPPPTIIIQEYHPPDDGMDQTRCRLIVICGTGERMRGASSLQITHVVASVSPLSTLAAHAMRDTLPNVRQQYDYPQDTGNVGEMVRYRTAWQRCAKKECDSKVPLQRACSRLLQRYCFEA